MNCNQVIYLVWKFELGFAKKIRGKVKAVIRQGMIILDWGKNMHRKPRTEGKHLREIERSLEGFMDNEARGGGKSQIIQNLLDGVKVIKLSRAMGNHYTVHFKQGSVMITSYVRSLLLILRASSSLLTLLISSMLFTFSIRDIN